MKKEFITEAKRKAIISEKEKAIVESFAKNFNRIKRIDEENYPKQDTNIDELIASFKEANGITDDIIGVKKYIELAELRQEEAEMADMEFYMNLWYGRLRAAKAKLAELTSRNQMNEVDSELLDFDIPEWALSSLINGDDSGLEDEDIEKINAFVDRIVARYGNANFMMNDIEGEDNLGFQPSNDIDNLGSNVYRLYLRPSKNQMDEFDIS